MLYTLIVKSLKTTSTSNKYSTQTLSTLLSHDVVLGRDVTVASVAQG